MATKSHTHNNHVDAQRLLVAALSAFLLLSCTIDALDPVLETAALFPRSDIIEPPR